MLLRLENLNVHRDRERLWKAHLGVSKPFEYLVGHPQSDVHRGGIVCFCYRLHKVLYPSTVLAHFQKRYQMADPLSCRHCHMLDDSTGRFEVRLIVFR